MTEPSNSLQPNTVYAVAGPGIIAKIFDGELTLINLDTGQYFAAGGSAVEVWEAVSAGSTPAAVAGCLLKIYETEPESAAADAGRILALLLEHGLISASAETLSSEIVASSNGRKPWQPGWIEVYGDMKELLLLDPIHDVDEAWPKAKQEEAP